MFGKRYDGRRVKTVESFMRIVPYIMKHRHDSQLFFTEDVDCAQMDEYIQKRKAEGRKLTYMHILIAAMARTIALRPRLNRFVMNGQIYHRKWIEISFAMHHTLRDETTETTIKIKLTGLETLDQICDMLDAEIEKNTVDFGKNNTDKTAAIIMKIPGFLIMRTVDLVKFLDKYGILPSPIIEASPFHTSLFVTNVKSLGINTIYHHIYDFGTTSLFVAMGKEKKQIVINALGEQEIRKIMQMGIVADERICDGMYYARSIKMCKRFLRDPACLETALEAIEEDIP